MPYFSTKTYGHDIGLSTAFRQHRAASHCNKLHGYALSVRLVFEANALDANNWVMDFGALKPIKLWLEAMFNHKTLVARDDPEMKLFHELFQYGVIDLVVVEATGCEAFAKIIYDWVQHYTLTNYGWRVTLESVTVAEHGANSAIYTGASDANKKESVPSRPDL